MLTKIDVDRAALSALVAPLGDLTAVEPLTGGMFASAYRLTLADGSVVVLKAVRADTSRLFSYEHGILRTEAAVYRAAAGSGAPVPRVLLEDFTRSHLAGDAVVTAHLPGRVWETLTLDDGATPAVRRRLGAVMASLHALTGDTFGYPSPSSGLQAGTWREAFGAMVEAVLADGERWGVELPTARVRRAVAAHAAALDAVARPAVVHADLWPGNVFLDPGTQEIVGVIDCERTVWGDPLLDLIGSDQMGNGEADPDVVAGNASAGGLLATELASPSGPARLALCRAYYSLILVVEPTVRGYEGDWVSGFESRSRETLATALGRLEALAGTTTA